MDEISKMGRTALRGEHLIIFLSCVKSKREHAAAAADMYTSDLFKKSYRYAQSLQPDKIYIISAKYGLLETTDMIEPYEQTLNTYGAAKRLKFGKYVKQQLFKKRVDFNDDAIFLCGARYREHIMPLFPNSVAPLKNLGIGKQLQFYKNNLK